MKTDNGAVVIVLVVRGECEGRGGEERLGSAQGASRRRERQARRCAWNGQAQDTPSANRLLVTKERQEYERSASVYVSD
jgi:hypothetical protein